MHSPDEQVKKAEQEVRDAEREIKQAGEEMAHAQRDLERAEHDLEEAEKHEVIHFEVDGEPEETRQRWWTPDNIIRKFGKKDPTTNYLVRIAHGVNEESYRGKGDVEIKLHNGMCFQVIAVGPTTVSDGSIKTGIAAFMEGLHQLGYAPTVVQGLTNHCVFDYEVPAGRFVGRKVRLGFEVSPEFPAVVPSGPCVSPPIHPTQPAGVHPTGGIHETHAAPFSAAGGSWQYWSRPYPHPATAREPVKSYMNFIWTLWDTQ